MANAALYSFRFDNMEHFTVLSDPDTSPYETMSHSRRLKVSWRDRSIFALDQGVSGCTSIQSSHLQECPSPLRSPLTTHTTSPSPLGPGPILQFTSIGMGRVVRIPNPNTKEPPGNSSAWGLSFRHGPLEVPIQGSEGVSLLQRILRPQWRRVNTTQRCARSPQLTPVGQSVLSDYRSVRIWASYILSFGFSIRRPHGGVPSCV